MPASRTAAVQGGFALMAARLQGDHQGAVCRVHPVRAGVLDTGDLGVVFPGGMVPAARRHVSVAHQYGPHRGIGTGLPTTPLGKGYGLAHKGSVIQFRHGSLLRFER